MGSPLLTPEQIEAEFGMAAQVVKRFARDGMIAHTRRVARKEITILISRGEADKLAHFYGRVRADLNAGKPIIMKWPLPTKRTAGVYFIGAGEAVKIGIAGCIQSRAKSLQTSSPAPLMLMGWETPADRRARERELHERFASARMAGEWFHITDALKTYISDLAQFYWGLRGHGSGRRDG